MDVQHFRDLARAWSAFDDPAIRRALWPIVKSGPLPREALGIIIGLAALWGVGLGCGIPWWIGRVRGAPVQEWTIAGGGLLGACLGMALGFGVWLLIRRNATYGWWSTLNDWNRDYTLLRSGAWLVFAEVVWIGSITALGGVPWIWSEAYREFGDGRLFSGLLWTAGLVFLTVILLGLWTFCGLLLPVVTRTVSFTLGLIATGLVLGFCFGPEPVFRHCLPLWLGCTVLLCVLQVGYRLIRFRPKPGSLAERMPDDDPVGGPLSQPGRIERAIRLTDDPDWAACMEALDRQRDQRPSTEDAVGALRIDDVSAYDLFKNALYLAGEGGRSVKNLSLATHSFRSQKGMERQQLLTWALEGAIEAARGHVARLLGTEPEDLFLTQAPVHHLLCAECHVRADWQKTADASLGSWPGCRNCGGTATLQLVPDPITVHLQRSAHDEAPRGNRASLAITANCDPLPDFDRIEICTDDEALVQAFLKRVGDDGDAVRLGYTRRADWTAAEGVCLSRELESKLDAAFAGPDICEPRPLTQPTPGWPSQFSQQSDLGRVAGFAVFLVFIGLGVSWLCTGAYDGAFYGSYSSVIRVLAGVRADEVVVLIPGPPGPPMREVHPIWVLKFEEDDETQSVNQSELEDLDQLVGKPLVVEFYQDRFTPEPVMHSFDDPRTGDRIDFRR